MLFRSHDIDDQDDDDVDEGDSDDDDDEDDDNDSDNDEDHEDDDDDVLAARCGDDVSACWRHFFPTLTSVSKEESVTHEALFDSLIPILLPYHGHFLNVGHGK